MDSKQGDYEALQDFYDAMNGPNWDDNTGWETMTPETMGDAFGVVVYGSSHQYAGRIKELNLSGYPIGRTSDGSLRDGAPIGNNLSGKRFPDSFSNLKKMTHLRLKGNNIRAGVMWLADFAGSLLKWCSLNGSTSYGGQEELQIDDYTHYNHGSKSWKSYNKFNGFMPNDLSGLTNLEFLELQSTVLIGSLPTYLPSSLKGLFLNHSSMSSDIGKTEWSNLTNLTHLFLSNRDEGNRGEGIIGSINHVSDNLYNVTFSSGSLPDRSAGAGEWWAVMGKTAVEVQSVSGGTFTIELLGGEVPDIGDEFIIAEGTEGKRNLYGELPDDWDNMREMRWFSLGGNNFSGDIPQWTSWYDLRFFGLSNNGSMVTDFPEWLVNDSNKHSKLHTLGLGRLGMHGGTVGVQGKIPETAANGGIGSAEFIVNNGELTGPVPSWIPNAIQLDFSNNDFSGTFPDQSHNSRLRWIKAENNNYTGSLPAVDPTHGNFQQMRFHNNQFSGDIPDHYGQIESTGGLPFTDLLLHDNLLDGNIPEGMFGNGWRITLENNKYTPEDLVPILDQNLSNVSYLPQKPFGRSETVAVGTVIDRSSFAYSGNSYQWYKDGNTLSGETSPTVDSGIYGEGTYRLEITHSSINYTFESEPVEVTTDGGSTNPPNIPTLSSPQDGTTSLTTSPVLDWNTATGANTYRLQVAIASDFSAVVEDSSGFTSTQLEVSGLDNSTTYYWRVQASNSEGTSDWSASWDFTTKATTDTSLAADFVLKISGSEGMRMISSPAANKTLDDLLSPLWNQGVTGSDAEQAEPNIFVWNEENQSFEVPSSMSNVMEPGKGYITWVFEDDDPNADGVQGGFPKVLGLEGSENSSPVTLPVSITDANNSSSIDGQEGWNLVGNPYNVPVLVDEILAAAREVNSQVNSNLYVWDHSTSDYISLAEGEGHTIAPFQVFWLRYLTVDEGTLTLDKSTISASKNKSSDRLANSKSQNATNHLVTLKLEVDSTESDKFSVELSNKGKIGVDLLDAYELSSLNPLNNIGNSSVHLYSIDFETKERFSKSVLPDTLTGELQVQLGFYTSDDGEVTLRWSDFANIPQGWMVKLEDVHENRTINLREQDEYTFNSSPGRHDSRFKLIISTDALSGGPTSVEKPQSISLSQNYPNPFNPSTEIKYTVDSEAEVSLTVYSLIGKKVVTLIDDQMKNKGTYTTQFDASRLSSGIYIYRLSVDNKVLTKKMTLIK